MGGPRKSYKDVVRGANEATIYCLKEDKPKRKEEEEDTGRYEKTRVIYGDVNKEMMQELSHSIIGESLYSMKAMLMDEKLRRVFRSIVSVKEMAAYNILITFTSKDGIEEALKESGDLLHKYFDEVRAWSIEEVCQTRRVWL